MATARIYRTQGAGTRTKWTYSVWCKFNMSAIAQAYWKNTLLCGYKASDNYTQMNIQNSG